MRVVTRADLDGIVCAVILKRVIKVTDYLFTEAFPLQHGEVEIREGDVINNLPYREGCTLWFDHHASNEPSGEIPGKWALEPSAARVVFDNYEAHSPQIHAFSEMVHQTDRVDSANITAEEIANPSGFFLIELTINPKQPADEPYWLHLIDLMNRSDGKVAAILADPEVKKRTDVVLEEIEQYRTLLAKHSQLRNNIVVTDLRSIDKLPAENRFLIYGMFPEAEVSVKLASVRSDKGHLVKISLGRSIVNRNSTVNLGELLAKHGGGGHAAAGSVHVPFGEEEPVLSNLLSALIVEV